MSRTSQPQQNFSFMEEPMPPRMEHPTSWRHDMLKNPSRTDIEKAKDNLLTLSELKAKAPEEIVQALRHMHVIRNEDDAIQLFGMGQPSERNGDFGDIDAYPRFLRTTMLQIANTALTAFINGRGNSPWDALKHIQIENRTHSFSDEYRAALEQKKRRAS